jgi:hypothetical protein
LPLAAICIANASTAANLAEAPDLIPGFPSNLVVEHVLEPHFEVPRDLARLRAVSPGMRDVVKTSGSEVKNRRSRITSTDLLCSDT